MKLPRTSTLPRTPPARPRAVLAAATGPALARGRLDGLYTR